MNGQNIAWNLNAPANTDLVGQGDDQIRSDKSAIYTAMNDEHNWPATGGAGTGYHRFGSARPYSGTVSQVSSDGTVSRLMLTSDTSELYALNATTAFPVGGAFALLAANASGVYTPTSKSKLAVQFGTAQISGSQSSVGVSFAGSGYSGVPATFVTPITGNLPAWIFVVGGNASKLSIYRYDPTTLGLSTNALSAFCYWLSIGTVSTGQP